MSIFKKKRPPEDRVEARFQDAVDLIRDLDKPEFNRMIKALEQIWNGYNTVRQVRTTDEKEISDINDIEKSFNR